MSQHKSSDFPVAILVLAAGASSRMGTVKAILKWQGKSLINHAIDLALSVDQIGLMVVLGSDKDEIEKEIMNKEVKVVVNEYWAKGMGKSISVGAEAILNHWPQIQGILIMLADQPILSKGIFLELLDNVKSDPDSISATHYGNRRYGVPALFPRSYFPELLKLEADKGAREILNNSAITINGVEGGNMVFDIDTPEDLEKLRKINLRS